MNPSDWRTPVRQQQNQQKMRAKDDADRALSQALRDAELSPAADATPDAPVAESGEKSHEWSAERKRNVIDKYLSCNQKIKSLLAEADMGELELIERCVGGYRKHRIDEEEKRGRMMREARRRKAVIHLQILDMAEDDIKRYRDFCQELGLAAMDEDTLISSLEFQESSDGQASKPLSGRRPLSSVKALNGATKTNDESRKGYWNKYRFTLFGREYLWNGVARKPAVVKVWLGLGNSLNDALIPEGERTPSETNLTKRRKMQELPNGYDAEIKQAMDAYDKRYAKAA